MPKRSFATKTIIGSAEMESRSSVAPPRKRFKNSVLQSERGERDDCEESRAVGILNPEDGRPDSDSEERRDSGDEREEVCRRDSVASVPVPVAIVAAVQQQQPTPKPTKGIILRSGRVRLPDKLMQYLNNDVTPSLFWQPDGQGFSIDCDKIQTELLDKFFHGSKLSSFLRSLNRWGFKRLFYHSMPKNTLSFHNPLFRKDDPELCKDMNMAPCSSGAATTAAPAETKKKVKAAPKEAREEAAAEESKPVAEVASQVASKPAPIVAPAATPVPSPPSLTPLSPAVVAPAPPPAALATPAAAPSTVLSQPQIAAASLSIQPASLSLQPASLSIQPAMAIPTVQLQAVASLGSNTPLVTSLLGQIKTQEQLQALLPQPNTQTPLDLLEGVLSSLVMGGLQQQQQQATLANVNPQMIALAAALSRAQAPSVPPPAPPPQQQVLPASTVALLQLLTPAQQLEFINQLSAGTNATGQPNPRI